MIYVWDLFGVESDVKTNAGGEGAKKHKKSSATKAAEQIQISVMCIHKMKNSNSKKSR